MQSHYRQTLLNFDVIYLFSVLIHHELEYIQPLMQVKCLFGTFLKRIKRNEHPIFNIIKIFLLDSQYL